MEGHNIKICRLCLSIIEDENFEVLEELRAEMLRTILVNFNPFVTYDPILCYKCNDNLQKCYDFKTICLNNQDCAKTFIDVNNPLKANLQDVRGLFEDGKAREGQKMCRMCFNFNSSYFANVNDIIEDRSVQSMLMSCMPELNLDLTNEPLVCQPCLYLLKRQLTFMQDCLEMEERINAYSKLKRTSNGDFINLFDVRQFFENIEVENNGVRIISILANETNARPEAVFIKTEVENGEMEDENNSENVETERDEENTSLQNPDQEESNDTVEEQSSLVSDIISSDKKFSCPNCSYTTKHKHSLKSHAMTHKNPTEIIMFQCTICGHETKRHGDLKAHMIIHKDPSEVQMFKCTVCTYESRRKVDLKNHMYTHNKEPYKCKYCPFTSKSFHTVTRHTATHKGRRIFRCLQCPYTFKDKTQFTEHSQQHESPEKPLFCCITCEFSTHCKRNLKKHLVVHKDIPEDEMFTCYICNFKSKLKSALRKHMVIHRNPSGVAYTCEQCGYMTRVRSYFKNHLKCHKDLSEVQTFSCTVCSFRTRWKRSLSDHMFQHDGHSEEVHKCDKCSYSSKIPRNLRRHVKSMHSKNSLE